VLAREEIVSSFPKAGFTDASPSTRSVTVSRVANEAGMELVRVANQNAVDLISLKFEKRDLIKACFQMRKNAPTRRSAAGGRL
jgi:hypothetical protein